MYTLQNWFRQEYSRKPLQPASRGSTILLKLLQGHKSNLYARDMCRVTISLVIFPFASSTYMIFSSILLIWFPIRIICTKSFSSAKIMASPSSLFLLSARWSFWAIMCPALAPPFFRSTAPPSLSSLVQWINLLSNDS